MPRIWIVVPALNEAENLVEVVPAMLRQLRRYDEGSAVVVVDDGSRDGTQKVLADLAAEHGDLVRSIRHRANEGKAVALRDGFAAALDGGADVVVMMDADGQDDPVELPRLLERLDAGADLVTGARSAGRRDRFVKRTTSRTYNAVTRWLSGTPGTDFNSGFKVMRTDVAADLLPYLYGELHRYITPIAHWRGFVTGEVQVVHHPRLHGKTKYGASRFWRGFVDLMTIRFLMRYSNRPSHLFTGLGVLGMVIGVGILVYLLIDWLLGHQIGERPLLTLGVLIFLAGLQVTIFGALAELVVANRQATASPRRGR
ncbi:MAG: glycosyltransferase family 2 protein [Microbacterium sp.]|nr:glycosyltransferase family 2 protein [Microbacterium sp.]